jgi:hypothetical protein
MKNILSIGLLVCQITVFAQSYQTDFPQTDTIIKEDSMNLAIFKVDFVTNHFHSANISYYTKCNNNCDLDSLPVLMYFDGWYDLARVYFFYKFDTSLLFGAWIFWMGVGYIFYPTSFTPASYFPYDSTKIPLPADAEYYNVNVIGAYCTYDEYIARGKKAWDTISSLEIVHHFAEKPFYVGLYAYSPADGMDFDPYRLDWIIFLYRGNQWPAQVPMPPEEKPFIICPNPAEGQIVLKVGSTRDEGQITVFLYDIFGRKVKVVDLPSGQKEYQIDISKLPVGIYVAELISEDGIIGRQKMVVK